MDSDLGGAKHGPKRKADPKPVFCGGVISLLFLVVFFFLQSRNGPLAEMPEA